MVVLSFLNSDKIVLYSIWVYSLYFFVKIFYHIYLLCCGEQACATECMLGSYDYFYDLAFLFHYVVLGIELRSSALQQPPMPTESPHTAPSVFITKSA